MNPDKCNCPFFRFFLFLGSVIIALAIWYFDEGVNSFAFLTDKNEIFNFIGTVFFIAIPPFGIFYLVSEKEHLKNKARLLALLGFLPAILFMFYILF
jgi:hypothetical protein